MSGSTLASGYDPQLFLPCPDEAQRRALFKRHVNNVCIETQPHCNRSCTYCPIDQRQGVHPMADAVFEQILGELAAIDYDRLVCLQVYGEPLLDMRDILRRAREARRLLPSAYLYFSTNGDHLTRSVLDDLAAVGLDRITVSIHSVAPYDDRNVLNTYHSLVRRSGLALRFTDVRPGSMIAATARHKSMDIVLRAINFDQHGANRGGLLEQIPVPKPRLASCLRPFEDFVISFNAEAYPCCNFVAGVPTHARFALGKVGPGCTIFDLYAGQRQTAWRRRLFLQGPKPAPCDSCAMGATDLSPEEAESRRAFLENLPGDDTAQIG